MCFITQTNGNGMKKHCSLSAVTVDGFTDVSNNDINLKPSSPFGILLLYFKMIKPEWGALL